MSGSTQSFCDQKQLGIFLQSTNLLKIIEDAAKSHVRNFQQYNSPENSLAAIIVRLPFVYSDFIKHIDLLHFLIEEPLLFENALKYKVYALIRDFIKQSSGEYVLKSIGLEQVHILLTVIGLPAQRKLIFNPSKNCFPRGLSSIVGILAGYTEPEKYTIQSVWFCATGCNRNRINSKSTEAPICYNCSKPMNEYIKLRVTQEIRFIRFLPEATIQTPRVINKLFNAVNINLKEHSYTCDLVLGNSYCATGYYKFHSNVQEFMAWSLIQH